MNADQSLTVPQPPSRGPADFSTTGVLVVALLIHTIATLGIGVQPLLVQGYVDVLHFSAEEAGYIAFAENGGGAVGAVILAIVGCRLSLRSGLMAACAMSCLSNVASAAATTYGLFFASRLVCGIAVGMIISLMYSALGKTPRADRNFGFALALMMISAAGMFMVLPAIMVKMGLREIFFGFAAITVLMAVSAMYFPRELEKSTEPSVEFGGLRIRGKNFALMAMVAYFIGLGSIWTYLFLIGTQSGMSSEAVGDTFALSNLFGIVGASLAGWITGRFRRSISLALSIVGTAGPLLLLNGDVSGQLFAIAVCCFVGFQNMSHPVLLGTIAKLDGSGRLTILAAGAQMIGFTIGPAVGAETLRFWSYSGVIWGSASLFMLGLIFMHQAVRRNAELN